MKKGQSVLHCYPMTQLGITSLSDHNPVADVADRVVAELEKACDAENEECAVIAAKLLSDLGLARAAGQVAIAIRSRYRR